MPESDIEIDGEVEGVGYHVVANGVSVAVMLWDRDGVVDPHAVVDIVDTPLLAPGVSVIVRETDTEGVSEVVEYRVLGRGERVTERVEEREGV